MNTENVHINILFSLQILKIRAGVEGIEIEEEALQHLATLGAESTLRYAVQLLNPASQLAKAYHNSAINMTILKEVSELFSDAKQSSKILTNDNGYME